MSLFLLTAILWRFLIISVKWVFRWSIVDQRVLCVPAEHMSMSKIHVERRRLSSCIYLCYNRDYQPNRRNETRRDLHKFVVIAGAKQDSARCCDVLLCAVRVQCRDQAKRTYQQTATFLFLLLLYVRLCLRCNWFIYGHSVRWPERSNDGMGASRTAAAAVLERNQHTLTSYAIRKWC